MKRDLSKKGSFTLPGEAGFEELTLRLAEKWGADVIRDSDGTQLSDKIVTSGYDIYSTLCLVRSDNAWARANMDKLQQNYLMSSPVVAENNTVNIDLLKGYFKEQFILNIVDDPKEWWQVFDRTTGEEIPADKWEFDSFKGVVTIHCATRWHKYGKKAYVFYDDHWIGVEPYGERFKDLNFDGIIKCVFNGFEARMCAGVTGVETHELRLHPYLFPTGLTGEPTFKAGGNPTLDCKNFWVKIRRALLRTSVDRIGLGGYLHLVQGFPDFIEYMEELINEFRLLKSFHQDGKPYSAPCKVAVLTAWGKLRSWICSGHMHEHPELELNRIIECLAGLPLEVEFISFEDILKTGVPGDVKVIINAGRLDSAWSGGANWSNPVVIEKITEWVANGGGLIGVGEPSAAKHSSQYFQLSHVFGVEREIGTSICKIKYAYKKASAKHFITEDLSGEADFDKDVDNVYVTESDTLVLSDKDNSLLFVNTLLLWVRYKC